MASSGREARIRPEYQGLYRGLQTAEWKPVEALVRHIAELSPEDRGKAGLADGSRLLRDDHFEFRGFSPRPEGVPPKLSRATDGGFDPRRAAALQGRLDAEQGQLTMRQRQADQTIARAEQLRERADTLRQDFERLRQRAAELDLRFEQPNPKEPPPETQNT